MKPYTHFTQKEVCCLFYLLSNGASQSQIAKVLNRHRSSVGRLIKRCPGEGFNPESSYGNYLENRKRCVRQKRIAKGSALYDYVREKLSRYWPPETIALKWNESHPDGRVSFSTIYSAVKGGMFDGITPKSHLRRRGKRKYGRRSRFCTIQPEKTVHDLPEEAKCRGRLNDWEGDTIRTAPGKGCIVTLVDRKSRFLLAKKAGSMA